MSNIPTDRGAADGPTAVADGGWSTDGAAFTDALVAAATGAQHLDAAVLDGGDVGRRR